MEIVRVDSRKRTILAKTENDNGVSSGPQLFENIARPSARGKHADVIQVTGSDVTRVTAAHGAVTSSEEDDRQEVTSRFFKKKKKKSWSGLKLSHFVSFLSKDQQWQPF